MMPSPRTAVSVGLLIAFATAVEAQQPQQWPAEPYRATGDSWGTLPNGMEWGATSTIDVAPDGQTIWVAERCGANDCRGVSDRPTIFHMDFDGNVLHAFGEGLVNWPHGFDVDHEGNVWVTDGRDDRALSAAEGTATTAATVTGHQVLKFSPTGELLLTLGDPGGGTRPSSYFWQPNDVQVAPNGDIFVAEGHSSADGSTARVLKFDGEGEFITAWGELGTADGQFDQPHALEMDSQGRLFVADRGNSRIQIFTQDGEHLATWTQFGRPSGLFIDENDILYATDSESNTRRNPGWRRGVYIGSVRDGWVSEFISDPEPDPDDSGTSGGEGVAVDATGAVYTAEVGPRRVRKFVR
ncbi:MAG: peptidyl-alpha-hydroxyglycine alpha-amidating lyase family protein [Gemmatimonadota bacterium]